MGIGIAAAADSRTGGPLSFQFPYQYVNKILRFCWFCGLGVRRFRREGVHPRERVPGDARPCLTDSAFPAAMGGWFGTFFRSVQSGFFPLLPTHSALQFPEHPQFRTFRRAFYDIMVEYEYGDYGCKFGNRRSLGHCLRKTRRQPLSLRTK